jgi:hypothetical protein
VKVTILEKSIWGDKQLLDELTQRRGPNVIVFFICRGRRYISLCVWWRGRGAIHSSLLWLAMVR